jgi:hypothetical protein
LCQCRPIGRFDARKHNARLCGHALDARLRAGPEDVGDRERVSFGSRLSAEENGSQMKDASWRLNRLRRKVYRKTPVGTESSSGSTALALSRSFTKKGFRAWCYEFGFSGGLTHTVTIVGADGLLRIHDAFFNLCYPAGLYEVLDALRGGM